MTRLCLDTSAYSQFKRGEPAAVTALRRARVVGVPTVVLGELRAGFRMGRRADRNELELQAFVAQPPVKVLDVDDAAASHYADLVTDLRRRGTPLPTNDIWIGAVALRDGLTVLTYDEHFASLPRVSARILAPGARDA